jgi:hypothetical protein
MPELFLRSAKTAELHVWGFDLLVMNGKPLSAVKERSP